MSIQSADSTGVVVLGAESQGLGIIRQLAEYDVPIIVVDQDLLGIARASRYCRVFFRSPPYRDGEAFSSFLIELCRQRKLEGWTLFPTDDEQVIAISKHCEKLSKHYVIWTPDWEQCSVLLHKDLFYQKADELGLLAPVSASLPGFLEGEEDCPFPAILKPVIKRNFFPAFRRKAVELADRGELENVLAKVGDRVPLDEMLLQEKIPREGSEQLSYVCFFKSGTPHYGFTARRVRQHPMDYGQASTYVATVDCGELEDISVMLLKAIDYYGICEVEFMRDPRDSQPKLLEVNARFWGWHTLARSCGVNYPYLLYCDIYDRPKPEWQLETGGASWVKNITDLPVGIREVFSRRMSIAELLTQNFGRRVENATFSWKDPLPFFAEYLLLPYLWAKRGY